MILLLLLACSPEPPPDPDIPLDALARARATLAEATRTDGLGHDEEARVLWRRSLDDFETHVEPALRVRLSSQEVLEVELAYGRLRAAIEGHEGCRREARALDAYLVSAEETLAEPVISETEATEGPTPE